MDSFACHINDCFFAESNSERKPCSCRGLRAESKEEGGDVLQIVSLGDGACQETDCQFMRNRPPELASQPAMRGIS